MEFYTEEPAIWTTEKANLFVPCPGSFDVAGVINRPLHSSQTWIRATEDGEVVGYGWIDKATCDYELSVIVSRTLSGRGYGSKILSRLEEVAAAQGAEQFIAVVKETNRSAVKTLQWLRSNGYELECGTFEEYLVGGLTSNVGLYKSARSS